MKREPKDERALLLVPFFARVLDSRSSFFAPKPHGNACYAGYSACKVQPNLFSFLEIVKARKFDMGFFGELIFGPGIFWVCWKP